MYCIKEYTIKNLHWSRTHAQIDSSWKNNFSQLCKNRVIITVKYVIVYNLNHQLPHSLLPYFIVK